jgi:GNAT superfamily N-acetyltransferase
MTISMPSLRTGGCSSWDEVADHTPHPLEWHAGADLTVSVETELRAFFLCAVDRDSWNQRYALRHSEEGVDKLLGSLRSKGCHLLLARDAKGVCIGVLDLHVQDDEAEVGLILASHQQRRGHGTRMAREAEAFARSQGLQRLLALPQGMGVPAFLAKLGFSPWPREDGRHERLVTPAPSTGEELGLTERDLGCIVF